MNDKNDAKRLSIVDDVNRRVTLVVALVAAVLVGLNYLVSVHDARAQVDDRADEVIVAIIEAFRLPFWDHNLSNAMEIATAFSANDWVVYVRVTDAASRPMAGVGMRADAAVFRQGEIRYGERLVGRVVIGLTLRPLDKQIRQAVRNSLAMLAVVVAALYLFNRTFLRRGLQRPVSLLLERIHRIARGDYEAPGPGIRHAEVREVVRQFDAMARKVEQRERSYLEANRQLQSAQAELTRHGEQLEATVAQRTRALEDEVQVRRQTEVELLHAKQDAERANRAKSDFVAQMSHELRTPLNGILGCAQILRNDACLGAPQREVLETLRQCGEHLLGLINEILDIAKIEAGRMDLEPRDFSLPKMLSGLERMFRPRAEDKGLAFVMSADASLPEVVHADERKLRQVLINLLGNAVKFTPSGRVALKASRRGDRVRFEVVDTGPGIAPERLPALFQPFTQLHHDLTARHEGTGLGLAISQRLTALMGGELRVENGPGRGCAFRFELALPQVDGAAAPDAAARDRAVAGYRGRARRVLVADDTAVDRKVLVGLLAPLGFQCIEAVDGEDCLRLVAAGPPPDAVLMDVAMPRLDGLEATRRLHALPGAEALPVIALSSSVGEAEREACLGAGCAAFVPKPLKVEDLLDALARCLRLDWVHRADEASVADAGPAAAVRFEPLPAAQAQALREAARKGHLKGIAGQAQAIEALGEPFAALARHIRELARQFRFDDIAALPEEGA